MTCYFHNKPKCGWRQPTAAYLAPCLQAPAKVEFSFFFLKIQVWKLADKTNTCWHWHQTLEASQIVCSFSFLSFQVRMCYPGFYNCIYTPFKKENEQKENKLTDLPLEKTKRKKKWIVLHRCGAFCSTGYVYWPFLLSEPGERASERGRWRQREEKRKEQEREKDERSLTLPDAHLPQRGDKRGLQEIRGGKTTLLCLHLIFFLFAVHLHGWYVSAGVWQLREVKKKKEQALAVSSGSPGEQLNEENPKKQTNKQTIQNKRHPTFWGEARPVTNTQATSLSLKGRVTVCGRWSFCN